MQTFQKVLARVPRQLEAPVLPYMVIGGQAVLLYGEPFENGLTAFGRTLGRDLVAIFSSLQKN